MEIDGVRILVKDLKKCFNFYRKDLDFLPTWGDENSNYASFDAGKRSTSPTSWPRCLATPP